MSCDDAKEGGGDTIIQSASLASISLDDEKPSEQPLYTSESRGSDEAGEGTKKVPYKTVLQAMRRHGKEPFPVIYQDSKEGSEAAKEGKLYCIEGVEHSSYLYL